MDEFIKRLDEMEREIRAEMELLNKALGHVMMARSSLQGRTVADETDDSTEKTEAAKWDDPPEEERVERSGRGLVTEKIDKPPDDPLTVMAKKSKTMYKSLTMSSSIVNVLSRAGKRIPATTVHEKLNAGGKEITLASTRAALSSMRQHLKCERVKVEGAPGKVTHYSLMPVSELV